VARHVPASRLNSPAAAARAPLILVRPPLDIRRDWEKQGRTKLLSNPKSKEPEFCAPVFDSE